MLVISWKEKSRIEAWPKIATATIKVPSLNNGKLLANHCISGNAL